MAAPDIEVIQGLRIFAVERDGMEVRVDVYHVTSLEAGPAKVDALRVLSYDIDAHPGTDGLLGRDFLGQFTVTVDTVAGRVTLSPRR